MAKLILTRGLPGSGKSTWAKAWVDESPNNRVRLNRDDFRAMIHGSYSGWDTEKAVATAQQASARAFLSNGTDVVVDDTNLKAAYVKDWLKLAREVGAEVEFNDSFLEVPLEVCIERNDQREPNNGRVPEGVIQEFHRRYLSRGKPKIPILDEDSSPEHGQYFGTPGADKAIIVDIDGTLALNESGRSPFEWLRVGEDSVNHPIVDLVRNLYMTGHSIIVMSGRDEICRSLTEDWLKNTAKIPDWEMLLMRPMNDNRKDSIVKLELFEQVRDLFDIKFVIDDRMQVVRAWRSIGLPVLQVDEGNF